MLPKSIFVETEVFDDSFFCRNSALSAAPVPKEAVAGTC